MSISSHKELSIQDALSNVPKPLRSRLIKFYTKLKQAYIKSDFDATGSRSGKFCETLIRCIQELLEGKHTPFGNQLNIYDESRRLEGLPKKIGPEPLRVFIPRALCFLYTLRNKRGFAHVGGDLDSEPIDAITCVRVADWCISEFIRIVHDIPIEDAQLIVNSIATKEIPNIWSIAGKKRVLKKELSYKNEVLLLLYSEMNEVILIEDLFEWTEHPRLYDFKRHVLDSLHSDRLIEWDKTTDTAIISPTGIKEVEEKILFEEFDEDLPAI